MSEKQTEKRKNHKSSGSTSPLGEDHDTGHCRDDRDSCPDDAAALELRL